jgi:hypothetical protein
MKKRVGFICSGQMRTNSLNPNYDRDTIVLDSFKKNILNDEFKSKYDYDFFISSDNISIEKSINFFGENLKNVNVTKKNWFLNPVNIEINPFEYYEDNFKKITQPFNNFMLHQHAVYQYYRMYCGYMMLKDYQLKTNTHYDFLVRIRPDIRVTQDLMFLFNLLESTNIKIILEHEQLCILKPELEEMFELIKHYGRYNQKAEPLKRVYMQFYNTEKGLSKEFLNIRYRISGDFLNDWVIRFSPEKQFVDHIDYLMSIKNLNPDKSYIGMAYPSYNLIYDNTKKYKYLSDNHPVNHDPNHVWGPYNDNDYIVKKSQD